jgi:ankyrin repeat protein
MEKLIEKKANVLALDDDKNVALHIAARSGHANLLESLIKAGTDVNRIFFTFRHC